MRRTALSILTLLSSIAPIASAQTLAARFERNESPARARLKPWI